MDFIDLLSCPICRIHAKKYVETHPIEWQDGNDMDEYFFVFHNHVNAHAAEKHRVVSREEADEMFVANLKDAGFDDINTAFCMEYWYMAVWAIETGAQNPAKPTEEEKAKLKSFLTRLPDVMPFNEVVHAGMKLSDAMRVNINVDDKVKSLLTLQQMYNNVCHAFDKPPITLDNLFRVVHEATQKEPYILGVRAKQTRMEDQRTIAKLQAQLAGQATPNSQATQLEEPQNSWWVIIVALMGLILIVLLIRVYYKKTKWSGNKSLEEVND